MRAAIGPLCTAMMALAATALPASPRGAASPGHRPEHLELHGLPGRLRTLTDLELVPKAPLSDFQKTEVLFTWLVEERREPSPATTGLGGYPIDSDWIQRNIVMVLAGVADPLVMRRLAASKQVRDPGLREGVDLALAVMGDKSRTPALIRILKTSRQPSFRAKAAAMLGSLGVHKAVPALKQALKDPHVVVSAGGLHSAKGDLHYPVRKTAAIALRVLKALRNQPEPDLGEYDRNRSARFERRLAEAQRNEAASDPHYLRLLAVARRIPVRIRATGL